MVFSKQAVEPRCKLQHRKLSPKLRRFSTIYTSRLILVPQYRISTQQKTYFTTLKQIALTSKATKENRREIRESLTVMVISSVHDHDQNYDRDGDGENGNGDGTAGYTGSGDPVECCSQSAECGAKELAHHFTRGFR